MSAYCVTCQTAIEFDDSGWRHLEPIWDLEHPAVPDVGLLSVRMEDA